jgi:hypothetical protein
MKIVRRGGERRGGEGGEWELRKEMIPHIG